MASPHPDAGAAPAARGRAAPGGVFAGEQGLTAPAAPLTRAQMAVLLAKLAVLEASAAMAADRWVTGGWPGTGLRPSPSRGSAHRPASLRRRDVVS
jgi:hypothetical protein